jgi:hypothetical protein
VREGDGEGAGETEGGRARFHPIAVEADRRRVPLGGGAKDRRRG